MRIAEGIQDRPLDRVRVHCLSDVPGPFAVVPESTGGRPVTGGMAWKKAVPFPFAEFRMNEQA